jgi:flagellar hook assembly protein FlgD
LNELGPIHVGNNVTSFKWNGTDEYGDKLATGVYIYQVITKINGEEIDHRNISADKYFKNNFGKLYILR